LQLYVDGHPTHATVRGVLDTEVNPSISNHGPIARSVIMPLASARDAMGRTDGVNLVLVHNNGTGGLDDLGPNGDTGAQISRQLSAEFTDPQAAADLWTFLRQPSIKTQIQKIHDTTSFLDPDKDLSRRLLVELGAPAVTDEFKALAGNRFVDRIMSYGVSLAAAANPTDQQAAQLDLQYRIAALQVDSSAAADLKALLADPSVRTPVVAAAAALPADDPARDAVTKLFVEVDNPQLTPAFKAMVGNPSLQKDLASGIASLAPAQLSRLTGITDRLDLYVFSQYKADAVFFAQQGGLFITGALLGVSFFSIAVGVLLIFLIFVMLAAERRADMGMSRAVGLKRRHLTQMFLFEGTAYTLVASAIGVALGVAVGAVMIQVLSSIFNGFYQGIHLTFHVEWTSLVIAVCLGLLLTFVVVAFSAYRVSRLNIVAAIRDLDESEQRDASLARLFVTPFAVAWFAIKQLARGHALVFLGRITFGTFGAIRTFWWSLFRRGPLTIVFGIGLIALNLWTNGPIYHVTLLYSAGVSLVIIGTGLLVRWILQIAHARNVIASRAGFTVAALGLLVFWGQPFGRIEDRLHISAALQLDQNNGGAEVFVLSAMMVLLAAIWLIMFNSDLLIRGVMFFTGRVRALAPVTRTSMAYPMSTKFRTGMAVAMFAIVTFVVVYLSVFKDVLVQNFGQVDAESGHWQVVAGTPDFNFNSTDRTSFPTDVASLVANDPAASRDVSGVGWENLSGVVLRQVKSDGTVENGAVRRGYSLHVVDRGYLTKTGYAIGPRAEGFTSDRAVWDAVRDHLGYAVLDTSSLDSMNGGLATVAGISPTAATFQPFELEVGTGERTHGIKPFRVTVIGFMTRPIWDGLYVSVDTAMASGNFSDPAAPATGLSAAVRPSTPTGYYFALKPGVDVNQARLDLGRLLASDALEPVSVADEMAQQINGTLTLLNLITGFLGLGLIVGIAGLGVISTRTVVERWQQIGMLRALGFRRALVQRSFLMESSLIALLGLLIGALIGLWESYRFFMVQKAFGTVLFHVPVIEIGVILVAAYLATLITTFMPARAASRVAPAEALRYE
ncbi:MAG TPA: FtsX-like permease family protein, partial [Candidatus Dormibacteraeota bacterium]|nr:FtsX-like permease family protein [Candidatus Dormibacteraeota bacterium]